MTVMRRLAAICIATSAIAAGAGTGLSAEDASAGYHAVQPSLVKVWALNAAGAPTDSGTGFVVFSNVDERSAIVVTAAHVISNADKVTIDVDRRTRDVPAA